MLPHWLVTGYMATSILMVMICAAICNLAHAQGRLKAQYIASVGGIPVGGGDWVVTISDKEYSAEVNGRGKQRQRQQYEAITPIGEDLFELVDGHYTHRYLPPPFTNPAERAAFRLA